MKRPNCLTPMSLMVHTMPIKNNCQFQLTAATDRFRHLPTISGTFPDSKYSKVTNALRGLTAPNIYGNLTSLQGHLKYRLLILKSLPEHPGLTCNFNLGATLAPPSSDPLGSWVLVQVDRWGCTKSMLLVVQQYIVDTHPRSSPSSRPIHTPQSDSLDYAPNSGRIVLARYSSGEHWTARTAYRPIGHKETPSQTSTDHHKMGFCHSITNILKHIWTHLLPQLFSIMPNN